MKALPCRLDPPNGYVPCEAGEATHLSLNFPGPTGLLTLPVQTHGKREGTLNWTWNGDTENPTLRPSVKTTSHLHTCHSWVTAGDVQFLDDTTHDLRGQTVPLNPIT